MKTAVQSQMPAYFQKIQLGMRSYWLLASNRIAKPTNRDAASRAGRARSKARRKTGRTFGMRRSA